MHCVFGIGIELVFGSFLGNLDRGQHGADARAAFELDRPGFVFVLGLNDFVSG